MGPGEQKRHKSQKQRELQEKHGLWELAGRLAGRYGKCCGLMKQPVGGGCSSGSVVIVVVNSGGTVVGRHGRCLYQ